MSSYSFPKSAHLLSPREFQQVYANKQFGGSKLFSFNVLGAQPVSRLGITVAKKVDKRAVERNRIKRRVREFYRHHQQELSNADLVITAKPVCAGVDGADIDADLAILWQAIKKWQRWFKHQKEPVN